MKFIPSQAVFFAVVLTNCSPSAKQQPKETTYKYQSQAKGFDAKKYNKTIIPDTTGCWLWIEPKDSGNDTLWNEAVVVKHNGRYPVLSTNKMRNYLWPCNLPSFLIDDDTIIVSGSIYDIAKNESMPGNPTLLKKISYSQKPHK